MAHTGQEVKLWRVFLHLDQSTVGTLSGNPLAMAAGIMTLDLLDEQAYDRLEELASYYKLMLNLFKARQSNAPR